MNVAEQYAKKYDNAFQDRFKTECEKTNKRFVILRFHVSRSNVNYLNSLGWGVVCVTPEHINYIRPTLYNVGAVFDAYFSKLVQEGAYFYVAYPCKYYILRANRAARIIQTKFKERRYFRVNEGVFTFLGEPTNEPEDLAETPDDENYSSGFESETCEAAAASDSRSETTEAAPAEDIRNTTIDEELNVVAYISKCHSETMRCGNCWKNIEEDANKKCWYTNTEEHTSEQRAAYRKFLSLDTQYLTSSDDGIGLKRDEAYRTFISLIGGRNPERLAAIRIVSEVIDEFDEDSPSESGSRSWVNSIFRSAGF